MSEEENVQLELDGAKKDQEEFEAAFEEATDDEPQTKEPDETGDLETKGDETDETGDDPLSKIPDTTTVVDDTAKSREQELEEELAAANHKMKTWDGRITAANARAKKAESELALKDKEPEEKDEEVLPDSKEEEVIKEFLDEFPDLYQPIIALVKRDLLPIIGQMIDERLGKVEKLLPEVQSIRTKMDDDVTAAHFKSIDDAHADWRQIAESGALDKWISSQPSYIEDALNTVKAEGSAIEVIDMFNQYKKAAGIKTTVSKTEPSKEVKKTTKAEDLLAVPATARSIVTDKATKDKEDFDGAWDEATKDGFK